MSTMLEQAIIDAAALRETAIKSAETALIEKYKNEFKDTVEKLLEQEETPADQTQEMSPDTAAANAADPTAPTITDQPDLSAGMSQPPQNQSKAFEKVKSAFFDLDGDDDELLTINFDGLKAKPVETPTIDMGMPMAAAPASPEAPLMENLDEDLEIDLEERYDAGHSWDSMLDETEDLEEELELDETDELDEQAVVDPKSAALRANAAKLKQQAARDETTASIADAAAQEKASQSDPSEEQEVTEEQIELTEEELNELEETLRVDMHNESEGYMGSHEKKKREFQNVAYAAARDDKKREEREKKERYLKDLQESFSSLQKKYNSQEKALKEITKENEDLSNFVNVLKEQVQKINLSNAKLLYTNKALSDDSFNERQKNNIVENISKALTVSEAKTIYETLQSTVQSVKSESTPKSLSEALNRNQSPFLARKQPASQNETFAERMKALAGIKRKE